MRPLVSFTRPFRDPHFVHLAATWVPFFVARNDTLPLRLAAPQPTLMEAVTGTPPTSTTSTSEAGAPGRSGPPSTMNRPPAHSGGLCCFVRA